MRERKSCGVGDGGIEVHTCVSLSVCVFLCVCVCVCVTSGVWSEIHVVTCKPRYRSPEALLVAVAWPRGGVRGGCPWPTPRAGRCRDKCVRHVCVNVCLCTCTRYVLYMCVHVYVYV